MKYRFMFNLLAVVLFLALAPAALASNTWYVDGVNGNDNNDCKSPQTACKTIGHAISLASSGDTIKVAPATYTENLTISVSLKILGANASTTIVDGGGANTVFTIPSKTANVRLAKLTIQNGAHAQRGGGVNNSGTLAISNSIISGNDGGYDGGGIMNYGTLTINNSTISGNGASLGGGGVYNTGTLTINNSTISGNGLFFVGVGGGGIYNLGALTISRSTIVGNRSGFCTFWCDGPGGGVNNAGTMALNNSTISGNVVKGRSDASHANPDKVCIPPC